ncbi:thiamine pyrophosphate-binding protein [Aquiluna sp.]|nr:thiamine pyrophosphate-binding protein [Aquiluna sp.]
MKTTGAKEFVRALQDLGIDDVFCITGAGNLALVDEVCLAGISVHYFHHEQAAAMAAIGYWRTTGRLPLVLVTTGGGTSNVATGVLSACLDSVPLLVVSGNESSYHISAMRGMRAFGVQGYESVEFLKPVSKHSERVSFASDVFCIVTLAGRYALTDRKGPVHLDFPMDIQREILGNLAEPSQAVGSLRELITASQTTLDLPFDLEDILSRLTAAKRPLIYIGQGLSEHESIRNFCRKSLIPYAVSWSAIDKHSDIDDLNIGRVGIYGDRAANHIVQQADLILCLGTRLSIPQVGYDRRDFGRCALKIVVDVDLNELNKHPREGYLALLGDANVLARAISSKQSVNSERKLWLTQIASTRNLLPRFEKEAKQNLGQKYVHSLAFISYLNELLDENAIITTDVGAGLLSGHYALRGNSMRTIFTSQGLGEMGFGLPGAIGAAIGTRSEMEARQVVCLNTDGGIMFNLQELQTLVTKKLPIKLVVFNNRGYSMIRISQSNLFDGRFEGSDSGQHLSFPNFEALARGFGLDYLRWDANSSSKDLSEALQSQEAMLIEVLMDPEQKYLPRLGTRKLQDGSLTSPPLEDLDPPLASAVMDQIEKVFRSE